MRTRKIFNFPVMWIESVDIRNFAKWIEIRVNIRNFTKWIEISLNIGNFTNYSNCKD